jgi:hypothetical protein
MIENQIDLYQLAVDPIQYLIVRGPSPKSMRVTPHSDSHGHLHSDNVTADCSGYASAGHSGNAASHSGDVTGPSGNTAGPSGNTAGHSEKTEYCWPFWQRPYCWPFWQPYTAGRSGNPAALAKSTMVLLVALITLGATMMASCGFISLHRTWSVGAPRRYKEVNINNRRLTISLGKIVSDNDQWPVTRYLDIVALCGSLWRS